MRESIKVIIAGGRDFNDYEFLKRRADAALRNCLPEGITIISGAAKGADVLGEQYAKERGYKLLQFPANWDKFGKSAGYKRNQLMAMHANALIAFWDGESKGTNHMIDIATKAGLLVKVFYY